MEGEALPHSAVIAICSEGEELREVESLYRSLIAEAKSPANIGRIRMSVAKRGNCIEILLTVDTLSHLRAVVNSILYLSSSALRTIELLNT